MARLLWLMREQGCQDLAAQSQRSIFEPCGGPDSGLPQFQMGRVPYFFSEIDSVQRRMWAILLNLRKSPAETPKGYVRRRARTAGQAACAAGLCSIRTARRVVAWEDHLGRPANAHSWPAHFLQTRGRKWLQEQIMQHSSLSLQSGRTGTRLLPGKPQTRWHDGAVCAREYVHSAQGAEPVSAAQRRRDLNRIVQTQRHARL